MSPETIKKDIEDAVPKLLDLAEKVSKNNISRNCRFILREIRHSEENFHVQRQERKKENDKKLPLTLDQIEPELQKLCDNLFDINLYVYRAEKDLTIVEISYYPRSSLDQAYRDKVRSKHSMLHCKVNQPPWLSDDKEKFDINWEHMES
jgi:hypothetical protein